MQQLIDVIRTAVSTDATDEQKAAGVQACRTITTALDTEPGKPLTFPGAATVPIAPRVSIDQVLDLVIARLSMIAMDRERTQLRPEPTAEVPAVALPAAPRGLRVPIAPSNALKIAPRSAIRRPVPQKAPPRSGPAPSRRP